MIDRRLHPEGVWKHLGTAGREAANSEGGDNSDAGTNTYPGTVADALGNTNTNTEGDVNTNAKSYTDADAVTTANFRVPRLFGAWLRAVH